MNKHFKAGEVTSDSTHGLFSYLQTKHTGDFQVSTGSFSGIIRYLPFHFYLGFMFTSSEVRWTELTELAQNTSSSRKLFNMQRIHHCLRAVLPGQFGHLNKLHVPQIYMHI